MWILRRDIQKDRAEEIVSSSTYHMKYVTAVICSLTIFGERSWTATSNIYKKYTDMMSKNEKSLPYRRVSDLLVNLESSGLLCLVPILGVE